MAVLWTTACYRRSGPTSETYGRKIYTVDHSIKYFPFTNYNIISQIYKEKYFIFVIISRLK